MFYLISPNEQNRICDIVKQPFEVAEPLFWIEVDETPVGYTATYQDGQIVFEEIIIKIPDYTMISKPARDAVFCIGYCAPDKGFISPNKEGGSYNQYSLLIEGSGYALNTTTNNQIVIDDVGTLYNLEAFKGSPINYTASNMGAKWVAVNPVNVESLDVTSIAGPNTYIIANNTNGITIFNAMGNVSINDISIELNNPTFYHANTELNIDVSANSYVLVIKY